MTDQDTTSTAQLAQPIDLPCGSRIKNRFFKSAMHEAMATRDHAPTERFATLYRRWAEGGAGVLMIGNVMVDDTQLGEPDNVALEDDHNLAVFRSWAEAATVNDTHCWVQFNHPGRQSPATIIRVLGLPAQAGSRANTANSSPSRANWAANRYTTSSIASRTPPVWPNRLDSPACNCMAHTAI